MSNSELNSERISNLGEARVIKPKEKGKLIYMEEYKKRRLKSNNREIKLQE